MIWLAALGTTCPPTSSWPRTPGCSTRSATGSTRHPPGRADQHLGGADQLHRARGRAARVLRLLPGDRRRVHRRGQRLAPGPPLGPSVGHRVFRRAMRLGLVVTLVAGIATAVTGDIQARLMDSQQPMKMAAAEALYNTSAVGLVLAVHHRHAERQPGAVVRVPYLLSLIATLNARHGAGHQQRPARLRQEVRARGLQAEHPGDLLVVPPDDRLRHAGRAVRLARAVADPAAPDPAQPLVLPGGHRPAATRTWPAPWAGSSPRWAASRGRCSAC